MLLTKITEQNTYKSASYINVTIYCCFLMAMSNNVCSGIKTAMVYFGQQGRPGMFVSMDIIQHVKVTASSFIQDINLEMVLLDMYHTHHIIAGGSPVPGCHYTHPSDGVHGHLWQGIREFPNFRHFTTVLTGTQINKIRIQTDWQETITPMESCGLAQLPVLYAN